jgi:hypothetical protein
MIYCVWYPSGGFGHFINAVLSLYGKNFVRPQGTLNFSSNGNSHSLDLVVPKYLHNCWPFEFEFDQHKNYSILVDNGITDENEDFKIKFPKATVIKICYSDQSWPVVARSMIEKAMISDIATQLPSWDKVDWAVREKYFLFLRDHDFRSAWQPKDDLVVYVDNLFEYTSFYNALESAGIELDNFETTWNHWRSSNDLYINPVQTAQKIISNIKQNINLDLSDINDLWTQAVIYYFIWLEFDVEVPHNDYANFFSDTDQIKKLIYETTHAG